MIKNAAVENTVKEVYNARAPMPPFFMDKNDMREVPPTMANAFSCAARVLEPKENV